MRNISKLLSAASLAVALSISIGAPASANLVTNPGFETGDFTGWTNGANSTFVAFNSLTGGLGPHSGTYFAALGNVGCCGTLSQTIIDTPGQTLNLTYWEGTDGTTPSYFDATWNGLIIPGSVLINQGASPYILYSFNVVATGSDLLLFHQQNDPSFLSLDDVGLAVPEPATLALLGAGLAGMGAMRRRRKAKV